MSAECTISNCDKPIRVISRGWCDVHYQRWRVHGDPTVNKKERKRGPNGDPFCGRCKLAKPVGEYSANRRRSDGIAIYCKPCSYIKKQEWRASHPEYSDPPRLPELIREDGRKWRAKNPGKVRDQAALYRARKVAATVERFSVQGIFERDGWSCHLCETQIDRELTYPDPMSASLDHVVPLSRGGAHSRRNCAASHLICNVRKQARVEAA